MVLEVIGMRATARARANVALVKYFGKRDLPLNLPATGSLSLTLEPLETVTSIAIDPALETDRVELDDEEAPRGFAARVSRFLDLVREMAGRDEKVRLSTTSTFPTAAGLASSASGFAAAALAASKAFGLDLDERGLSVLARRGSGSAARSIPGGAVVWEEGSTPDGTDSFAHSIAPPEDLPWSLVVGITDTGPKSIGSTEAMELTRLTSPLYSGWVESNRSDLAEAKEAVEKMDLEKLGDIAERSALTMHAAALASRPGIAYWNGSTIDALHLVREMRSNGTGAWFTCDAGPQPKVICSSSDELSVVRSMHQVEGIKGIIQCRPAGGAELI